MKERRFWAIVLAGGEGSRLAETTQRVYGSSLPKQFLSFGQDRTFLQATVDRIQPVIPPKRTVVVVAERHEDIARQQLSEFDGIEFVAQPRNVGTGPGVLLPLVHVLKRDPRADVALVPSDHDFRSPAIMRQALLGAKRAADTSNSAMVLLGAQAEGPASDLGWIRTKQIGRDCSVRPILEFVEKPAPPRADRLFRQGALWNTMLSVSRGEALWCLARRHLPLQAALFQSYASDAGGLNAHARLSQIYGCLSAADFSRDLVAASSRLRAIPMVGAGWSDCGTPERLAAALGRRPGLARAMTSPRIEVTEALSH
jgi:mannose-1-phosphate guanylyltransferase